MLLLANHISAICQASVYLYRNTSSYYIPMTRLHVVGVWTSSHCCSRIRMKFICKMQQHIRWMRTNTGFSHTYTHICADRQFSHRENVCAWCCIWHCRRCQCGMEMTIVVSSGSGSLTIAFAYPNEYIHMWREFMLSIERPNGTFWYLIIRLLIRFI